MFLSLNWLKDYVKIPSSLSAEKLGDVLTMHTVEVEGIEKQGDKFANVVIGKILEIRKHPNADRLQLTRVDVGKEKLDIVCGAPNIVVGQLVPVALVGAILPNGLEIKEADVRGEKSCGMLCAADELGLGSDHSGIMILDKSAKIGRSFSDYLKYDDIILEVDNKSLSNRPDLWGHVGIAREISAILDFKFTNYNPNTTNIYPNTSKIKIDVKVEDNKLCPRYMAVAMDNVKIEASPKWLQDRLTAVGQRPINNIVDITNYVMLELGQPMHAFDVATLNTDKTNKNEINECRIVVRKAKQGEIIETLDGEKRELDKEMLVIANAKNAVAIAGVMGGANSEINNQTTTVIFEAANFDYVSVRKTSQKLGLRTDSSMRFEKGLDPNLAELGIARAVELVNKVCPEAVVASEVVDIKNFQLNQGPILMKVEEFTQKIGTEIEKKKILNILEKLGFAVEVKKNDLSITIPSWRATKDVAIKEDIIEEVARVYGFNNLSASLPFIEMSAPKVLPERIFERRVKDILSFGANLDEVYNYSFVGEEQLKKLKIDFSSHVRLQNPIASHQTMLRRNLEPNLLDNIRSNQAKYDQIGIYEIGTVFNSFPGQVNKDNSGKETLPHQEKRIGIVIAGSKNDNVLSLVKGVVENLFLSFGLAVSFEQIEEDMPGWAAAKTTARIVMADDVNKSVGIVSLLENQTLKSVGIKKEVAVADISFNEFFNLSASIQEKQYEEVLKYPPVFRDMAFVVSAKVLYNNIRKEIESFNPLIKKVELFDVYEGDKLGVGKKSLAFNIIYQASDRTLASEEIDTLQKELAQKLEEKFEAKVRDF